MKKISLLFFLSCMICWLNAGAQKQFSDAQVTYQVKVTLPAGSPAQAADLFENSRLVYSFKSYLFRSDLYIGKKTYTNIRNARDHSAVSLVDNGGGTKYLIRFNAAESAAESKRFEGVRFTDESGSKEIAGYVCKKATGSLKDGTTFILYYTSELMPEDADYNGRFKGLKGLPLEFETVTRNQVKMTMTATHISLAPQPRAGFAIPTSGYREISYTELQSLRKPQ